MNNKTKKIEKPVTGNIQYAGKVVVKKVKGKRVLQSRTYHNKGMANLFNYLATALAGIWQHNQAPTCIQLFSLATQTDIKPNGFDWSEHIKQDDAATVPLMYETTPKIYRTSGSADSGYQVKYSFRIPYSLITKDRIHVVGIFPNKEPTGMVLADVLAYYLLINETGEWDPIEKETAAINQSSFSLVIEWTMEVSNQISGGSEA